ncbi:hypothetical protein KC19_12G136000 [Ceratodon purpureus]|uniref:Protein kinase domain-containing protein n=1 Tax=Ceratodon purpureus TaxID=3225 RepID=A0A8T0GAH7_CERPU|nr:hypothetical protein KC19_12G136000 [Ceratodon purpureus]
MSEAESRNDAASGRRGDGPRDEYFTAGKGDAPCEYVTARMDEVQIAADIQKSREQGWSEVADRVREGAVGASGGLSEENLLLWEELKEQDPHLFKDMGEDRLKLGQVIAEGGQAHIYDASVYLEEEKRWSVGFVAKVFKMEGFSLTELHRQWPRKTKPPSEGTYAHGFREYCRANKFSSPLLYETVLGGVVFGEYLKKCCQINSGTFLKDGRFAFVMEKYWSDLRTVINSRLMDNDFQGPPFSYDDVLKIISDIAIGMSGLHDRGVLHRDLKAANVLTINPIRPMGYRRKYQCSVADYESSMLVQGTGFWRAPEVLEDLLKKPCERNIEIWTEKVDVYSYAMTCYEVLTGHIPFDGYVKSDWKRVIDGERPHLPEYIDLKLRVLVQKCWHKDSLKRPSFEAIVDMLMKIKYSDNGKMPEDIDPIGKRVLD